jgi:hypothetical protein
MDSLIESLLTRWQSATLTDYAHVVLAIVIVAWFVSRYDR